jgi:hypothetical protein
MGDVMMEFPKTAADGRLRGGGDSAQDQISQLLLTLQELVDALDRRIPQIERAGEAAITAEAARLRACAMQRMALLRRERSDMDS